MYPGKSVERFIVNFLTMVGIFGLFAGIMYLFPEMSPKTQSSLTILFVLWSVSPFISSPLRLGLKIWSRSDQSRIEASTKILKKTVLGYLGTVLIFVIVRHLLVTS